MLYIPIFAYKVGDVEITKAICMQHFKNTVAIFYKVKNGSEKAKLILTPVMDFRNAHGMNKDHVFDLKQKINKTKLEVKIDNGVPIYMMLSEGNYIEHYNDTFKNMFYIEEEKRGFEAEENHVIPGRFEIEIEPNEEKEISVICSLEENIEELFSRALKNLSNSKPNNKNSGAATPLCCDPAFIRNFRKYLKNSPNNASQTYIWLHLTAFRVFLRHFRLICLHS